MKTLFLLLFSTILLDAATYTVKSGGGGNYTTIQACATGMSAGDTCTVYAGTYNENVTVTAGSVGNYKTLNVNGSDLVYVLSFTVSSHTKIIGFQIQTSGGGGACVSIGNSTDAYVTNNIMTQCGSGSMITTGTSASYIYIKGNTLSWACRTPASGTACDAIRWNGTHGLIENNDLSHYRLGINYYASQYSIFRSNTLHDQFETDSGQHTDAFFAEPASNEHTQYNVIEGNIQHHAIGPNAKGLLSQGDVCAGNCFNLIIRFNIGYDIDAGNITDDNAQKSGVNPGFSHVKSYNNTWVNTNESNTGYANATNDYSHNSTYPADINNIYYYGFAVASSGPRNPVSCDASTCSTGNWGHDLAYCDASGSGNCALYSHVYQSGLWTSDPGNLLGYIGASPSNNPNFVNLAGNDFRLQAGSPAIAAGTYLTTVAAGDSGAGTSLVVTDADYFQDGSGIIGVNGDCISVTTVGNHVCITAVNYSTKTLTMASGFSRTVGDAVWLYSDSTGRQVLVGSAPNIGATFAPSSSAAPPTSVSVILQ
jgi:hypothetical protein